MGAHEGIYVLQLQKQPTAFGKSARDDLCSILQDRQGPVPDWHTATTQEVEKLQQSVICTRL